MFLSGILAAAERPLSGRRRSPAPPPSGPANRNPSLAARDNWRCPGSQSSSQPQGRDWIVYHAVDSRRPRTDPKDDVNTRRILLIDRIVWRDGWPQIEANGPSSGPQTRPATR